MTRPLFDQAKQLLDGRRGRNDPELLDEQLCLHPREGQVSKALIDAWPYIACFDTYKRRFGGLGEACRRIGWPAPQVRT